RPLHPSDMHTLQDFFYSHDEETVRLRYGYQRDRMTGESAYKLAAVDQAKDHALGLFAEGRGREELRAIGRFYLDPSGSTAEVAFIVHEGTRRIGMAGFLLGELARVAKKRGIKEFWASVLAENHGMAALFTRAGGNSEGLGEEREFRMPVSRILRWRDSYLASKSIFRDTR
ncbi:MAG: GNAT family N-acetyltransferase, partial [Verrucomicrobiaceae bacterium]